MSTAPLPTGLSWKLGGIKVTSIVEQDLWWRVERFLPSATADVVAGFGWVSSFLADDPERFPLRIQAFIIDTGSHLVLVDTCAGNDKPRDFRDFNMLSTSFIDDMRAAGYDPADIDFVLCTHLHIDHVGWNTHLVDGRWVPTFPNARYLFGAVEHEYWIAETDELTTAIFDDSIKPVSEAGLVDLVELDHQVCEGVELTPTTGHTPGHVSVMITSADGAAVITGDMAHHPIQLARPDICSTADLDPDTAVATRRSRFAEWCDDEVLVIGTHFAPPTAGRLRVSGSGWELLS